jgi:hypothetical protein
MGIPVTKLSPRVAAAPGQEPISFKALREASLEKGGGWNQGGETRWPAPHFLVQ